MSRRLTRWRGWRNRNRGRRVGAAVDQILQFLARLEERNFLRRHFHAVASFWIAPDTRLALSGAKAPEAADLDLVADSQRSHHAVEDGLDYHFAVLAGQFRQPGNFFDQIRFCHMLLSSNSINAQCSGAERTKLTI